MTENRKPKPGKWWFSPDGKQRWFYCGVDGDGESLFEWPGYALNNNIPPDGVPVPDCTGWDWRLPEMPEGFELCGPPVNAVDCTFNRFFLEPNWHYCNIGCINNHSYTYCRPIKPAEVGSQKQPASLARIKAQLQSILNELADVEAEA